MKPIAKFSDPTSEGGRIIATKVQSVMVHGKLMAAGKIVVTVPGRSPLTLTKEGEGKVLAEGLRPFDSEDSPVVPESDDVLTN